MAMDPHSSGPTISSGLQNTSCSSVEEIIDVETGNRRESLWCPHRLNAIYGRVQSSCERDAQTRYRTESANRSLDREAITDGVAFEDHGRTIVAWDYQDNGNPENWPMKKKAPLVLTAMLIMANSALGSSLPSMAILALQLEWLVQIKAQLVLPVVIYLVGFVLGPGTWGPASEHYGRRRVTIIAFFFYLVWTLACACATSWAQFVVFRFLAGYFASSPLAVLPGTMADIYHKPRARGNAISLLAIGFITGAVIAPVITGYCLTEQSSWRWSFWAALIVAGISFIALLFLMPETNGPILLTRRAEQTRKVNPNARVYAARELEPHDMHHFSTVVLSRPTRMSLTEPILFVTTFYFSLVYGVFYELFEIYPLIFQGIYFLSYDVTGLCYLPILGGALLALPINWIWDGVYDKRAEAPDCTWTKWPSARRLPLACAGAVLYSVSLFWLGWAANPRISFTAPLVAGIPLGTAFALIFGALLNYLTDSYELFASSAASVLFASVSSSAIIAYFPIAPMFEAIGIGPTCSILGGMALLLAAAPGYLLWREERLRQRSKFCLELGRLKEEMVKRVMQRRRVAAVREVNIARERRMRAEAIQYGPEPGSESRSSYVPSSISKAYRKLGMTKSQGNMAAQRVREEQPPRPPSRGDRSSAAIAH